MAKTAVLAANAGLRPTITSSRATLFHHPNTFFLMSVTPAWSRSLGQCLPACGENATNDQSRRTRFVW